MAANLVSARVSRRVTRPWGRSAFPNAPATRRSARCATSPRGCVLRPRRPEMELVLILSERPSVPPGEFLEAYGEERRGNGSLDFAWLIFRRGGRRRADVA